MPGPTVPDHSSPAGSSTNALILSIGATSGLPQPPRRCSSSALRGHSSREPAKARTPKPSLRQ